MVKCALKHAVPGGHKLKLGCASAHKKQKAETVNLTT
jgi:hypothetical protein